MSSMVCDRFGRHCGAFPFPSYLHFLSGHRVVSRSDIISHAFEEYVRLNWAMVGVCVHVFLPSMVFHSLVARISFRSPGVQN
jgi:hypothetical protein